MFSTSTLPYSAKTTCRTLCLSFQSFRDRNIYVEALESSLIAISEILTGRKMKLKAQTRHKARERIFYHCFFLPHC